jgi:hypothetical protein
MYDQAETKRSDEDTARPHGAGLRVITADAPGPRDAEIVALRARITELEARPRISGEIGASASGHEPDAEQRRIVHEWAARLLADAWAEAQEIKRQTRAAAEQTEADLAAEAAALRATLVAEREAHDAAMAQERARHEAALRMLSAHRDRVIEQIAVLCRGMADAAHRAHEMAQGQPAAS